MSKTIANGLIPISKFKIKSNDFPLRVYPKQLQVIIMDANESLRYPIDFFAGSILYAFAVCMGNKIRVKIKNEWIDNPTIYLAIIGSPGANKSHPLNFAIKRIKERDGEQYDAYKQALNSEDEKASKAAKWPKTIVSDYTQEALAPLHENNAKGLGVYVDELAGFFRNFNRYNKGSEQQFWLSTWSGQDINVDRKGGRSYFIKNPCISIAGTIQPKTLKENRAFLKNGAGFFERFLYIFPGDQYKEPFSDKEMPPESTNDFKYAIDKLIDYVNSDVNADNAGRLICFTPEAKSIYKQWYIENAANINNITNEDVQQILTKYDNHFLRLALILQSIKFSFGTESLNVISEATAKDTVDLVKYFISNSIDVYELLGENSPLSILTEDKYEFYNMLEPLFKTSQAIALGNSFALQERVVKTFLSDATYFCKISHGEYIKRFEKDGGMIDIDEYKEKARNLNQHKSKQIAR